MLELLPFFIILFSGIFFGEFFGRFHVPWVVALIIGGMIIGPHGLSIFTPNETFEFLSQIGLVFLMFMAGLETRLLKDKKDGPKRDIVPIILLNGLLPFVTGVLVGYILGYPLVTSLLIGIIFISSSIAVIIPSLEANNLLRSKIGGAIVSSAIIEDVASLILLSVLLQSYDPITKLPLPVFYFLLISVVALAHVMIPKIRWFFKREIEQREDSDIFQEELRSIFVIMIGTVAVFQLLGLHPIIAGFFAGAVLSDTVKSKIMKEKLRALSYGIFIPIFFVVLGAKTDLSVFFDVSGVWLITTVIVLTAISSKFIGGYLGGAVSRFRPIENALIGSATIPQLSTTLAVVFAGFELGLLDSELVVAMVFLSLITVIISPILVAIFAKRYIDCEYNKHLDTLNKCEGKNIFAFSKEEKS